MKGKSPPHHEAGSAESLGQGDGEPKVSCRPLKDGAPDWVASALSPAQLKTPLPFQWRVLLAMSALPAMVKHVANVLEMHCHGKSNGYTWTIGAGEIAREASTHRDTVTRSTHGLDQAGWLVSQRGAWNEATRQYDCNTYSLAIPTTKPLFTTSRRRRLPVDTDKELADVGGHGKRSERAPLAAQNGKRTKDLTEPTDGGEAGECASLLLNPAAHAAELPLQLDALRTEFDHEDVAVVVAEFLEGRKRFAFPSDFRKAARAALALRAAPQPDQSQGPACEECSGSTHVFSEAHDGAIPCPSCRPDDHERFVRSAAEYLADVA